MEKKKLLKQNVLVDIFNLLTKGVTKSIAKQAFNDPQVQKAAIQFKKSLQKLNRVFDEKIQVLKKNNWA